MRGLFGLAGLLVVIGVIAWFMGRSGGGLDHTRQTLKEGEKAREQINQIAGNDPETGERANQSVALEATNLGTKMSGLLVLRVTPGGAYEKFFGIKRNDTIVAAEYQGTRMEVKGATDEAMAKAQVDEAFRFKGSIYVVRDNKEIKLPAAPAGGAQPPKGKDSVQQQLDAIQGIPR